MPRGVPSLHSEAHVDQLGKKNLSPLRRGLWGGPQTIFPFRPSAFAGCADADHANLFRLKLASPCSPTSPVTPLKLFTIALRWDNMRKRCVSSWEESGPKYYLLSNVLLAHTVLTHGFAGAHHDVSEE